MADVTNDLIYEVLKAIQVDVAAVKIDLRETKDELRAIRDHLNATNRDIANIYASLGRHDDQFERINRRLDLNDSAH